MLCGVRIFARGKESDMYIYEMHCHTQETSKCSRISGAELIDFYHKLGYTGVVITDHFFNGNTTVPADLPWAERVERFAEGYRAAKRRGDEIGVDVFFGWEFSILDCGNDFLTYGLDVDWLLANPGCDQLHLNDYCDLVHRDGGYVVHAHPFREAWYIDMIRLAPRKVDAVESINACRKPFENRMADQYAGNYGLHPFCGSDNHSGPLSKLSGLGLDFRADSVTAILEAVMRDEHSLHLYTYEEAVGLTEVPNEEIFADPS